MAKEKNPLDGVVRFIQTEGRQEELAALLAAHVTPACAAMGVAPETLPAQLDPQVYAMMITCVVEDLMTRPEADGQTLTDHYLKRHGWKLAGLVRRQLQALRDSKAALYEVASVSPGTGIGLRDLLAPETVLEVQAPTLAGALEVGCPLGVRVITVDGVAQLGAGILPFEVGMSAEAADAVRAAAADGNLAPAITSHWLLKTLEEKLGKPAALAAEPAGEAVAAED